MKPKHFILYLLIISFCFLGNAENSTLTPQGFNSPVHSTTAEQQQNYIFHGLTQNDHPKKKKASKKKKKKKPVKKKKKKKKKKPVHKKKKKKKTVHKKKKPVKKKK